MPVLNKKGGRRSSILLPPILPIEARGLALGKLEAWRTFPRLLTLDPADR
jgi:hypothetical protein